jgi:hypothetical protein
MKKFFCFIRSNNCGIRLKDIESEHEVHPLCEIIFYKLLVAVLNFLLENVFDTLVTFYEAILGVQHSVNNFSNCKVLVYEHIEET